MPRYIFPAGTVTNTTGAPLRLTFHATSTTGRRETDLWTVSGSDLSAPIPNGIILTDSASSAAYSAFAGPDDVEVLYLVAHNGSTRTAIVPTGVVTGGGGIFTLGRSNGTDDTTAINAVLALGGNVRGLPGESYIASTLVIPSSTTLDMTGCTVTQKTGTTGNLLRNYSQANPVATAADGAVSSGSNVVTTALGATAVVGQTLVVAGAGGNGNGPLVGTVSARDATTITLTTLDGRNSNSTHTVSSATVTLYNRDTNITVRGGTWAKGSNSDSTSPGALLFRHVDGLHVDIDNFTSSSTTRGVSPGGCTRFWIRVKNASFTGVIVFANGPLYQGHIDYVAGTTTDDVVAIQASDFAAHQDIAGDIIDVSVGTIVGTSSGALLGKVIAGAGRFVDNVRFGTISGSPGTYAAWCGDDTGDAATTGGTYGLVDFGTINAKVTTNALLWLIAPSAKHIKARLRNNQASSITRGAYMNGSSTSTIDLLELDFDIDATSNSGFSAAFEANAANVTITRALVTGRYAIPTGQVSPLALVSGGVITELNVNARVDGAAATGYMVRHVGGTLTRLNFLGGTLNAGNVAFRKDSTGTGNTVVTMGGGFTCLSTGRVADLRAGTVTFKLNHPHFDTITNAAFFTNAATLILDGAITTNGTFTLIQRNASESVSVYGSDLPVSSLAALTTTAGQVCNNTAAATGVYPGAGLVTCDGTTWRRMEIGAVKSATATLVGGTVTVADTAITAASEIRLRCATLGGTPGALYVSAKTASTSFVITSTSGTDTSVVAYDIVKY